MKRWVKILLIVLAIIVTLVVLLTASLAVLASKIIENQYESRSEKLRTAGAYTSDTVSFRFTQIPDTARATEIYQYFRLDTLLSPTASTWENAMRLARLVSDNVPHDNPPLTDEEWPQIYTAIGLWEHNQKRPGLNCRQHSIMLYEMLTAAGITNRFVTCFPEDSTDQDCHAW